MIAVFTSAWIVHWPALTSQALSFDDTQYLTNNTLVQQPSLRSAERFLSEVLEPSTVGGYYQPLAMISLMLDHAMGGRPGNLRAFHRTSLFMHAVNAALIVLLLFMLFEQIHIAGAIGLLFALHPMTVETIVWVGERKTVLASMFALISIVTYVRHAAGRRHITYGISLGAFVLALMSKPTVTMLPAVLILMDWWPLRRLSFRSIAEKTPFFAIAAISAVITVISQGRTQGTAMPGEHPPTFIPFVLAHNIVFYLMQIAWPISLSSHYPYPNPIALSHPMILTGVIGTTILFGVLLFSLKRTRALVGGWLIFFVAIFPTMGVIGFTTVIASDKYAYFPAIGLLMTATWLLVGIINRTNTSASTWKRWRFGGMIALVCVAGSEAALTRKYLTQWKTTDALYRHMTAYSPGVASLHWGWGSYLHANGRPIEAIEQFTRAIEIDPNSQEAHNNLGAAYASQGRIDDALAEYQLALECGPETADLMNNLGAAIATKGQLIEAESFFRKAIQRNPTHQDAHRNLGMTFASLGDFDKAIAELRLAVSINPVDARNQFSLGKALHITGNLPEAIRRFQQALQLDPGHAKAALRLQQALAERASR